MAVSLDPLKFRRETMIGGNVSTIIVGRQKKKFYVYKSLLYERARAFKKKTIPTANNSFELPDDDPKMFELYVLFLYTGDILCKADSSTSHTTQDCDLVDFYVLAERLDDPTAMHAALRALIYEYQRRGEFAKGVCKRAYNLTAQDSPLGKLFVHLCVWNDDTKKESYEGLPPELLEDAVHNMKLKRSEGETQDENTKSISCCDFHELEDGLQCVSKKRKRNEVNE